MSSNLIEQIFSILDTKDEDSWFQHLTELACQWGFNRVFFGILPRSGMKFDEMFQRSTYDASWLSKYSKEGFLGVDPVVSHCIFRTTPLIWTPDVFATQVQQNLYEEATGYGLRSGVTLPVPGPAGRRGLLCLASDRILDESFRQDVVFLLPNIGLLRDVLADRGRQFVNTLEGRRIPKLTKRELECLTWFAIGKTTWEVSRIFGCSEAAVNFHTMNIRRKFNVSSRRAAVLIALQLGIIDLLELPNCYSERPL